MASSINGPKADNGTVTGESKKPSIMEAMEGLFSYQNHSQPSEPQDCVDGRREIFPPVQAVEGFWAVEEI